MICKRPPVVVADHVGPIPGLKLSELVILGFTGVTVKRSSVLSAKQADRPVELAGKEVLPLSVRPPWFIGRPIPGFATVHETNQANDGVALLDPLLELLLDLQEGQVEDLLLVDVIPAFAQRLGRELTIASEVASRRAHKDASLGHAEWTFRTRGSRPGRAIFLDKRHVRTRHDRAAPGAFYSAASVNEMRRVQKRPRIARPWFGKGTSNLARQCDCAARFESSQRPATRDNRQLPTAN